MPNQSVAEEVTGVVWKSAVYHYRQPLMVGETDAALKADGKRVIALKPSQARQLCKECLASYPKPPAVRPERPELISRGIRRRKNA